MNDVNIKRRIGRHAKPGGIVIHIVAVPTGRLLDVKAVGPEDVGKQLTDTLHAELTDDEWSLAMLAYDGDSGRLIPPPSLSKPSRTLKVLHVIGVPILWVAVLINVLSVIRNLIAPREWWMIPMSIICLAISVTCLRIQYRLRPRARQYD